MLSIKLYANLTIEFRGSPYAFANSLFIYLFFLRLKLYFSPILLALVHFGPYTLKCSFWFPYFQVWLALFSILSKHSSWSLNFDLFWSFHFSHLTILFLKNEPEGTEMNQS